MKKPLALTILLTLIGVIICGVGYWYKTSTRKAQIRIITQAQSSHNTARVAAEQEEGQWSEQRLTEAKARADQFARMRISRAAWDEIVRTAGTEGIRIETNELRAGDTTEVRIRAVLQFSGMPASETNLNAIIELLERLDRTVGGCQQLHLGLGPLNPQTRLPGPIFADGSFAVYEFHIASANPL